MVHACDTQPMLYWVLRYDMLHWRV